MNDASQIIKEIKQKYKTMYEKMNEIEQIREEISGLKKVLYITCAHEWIRDDDEPFDSICKWKCKHCDLSRNPHCTYSSLLNASSSIRPIQ